MNAVKFAEEARLCEDKEDYRTKMNERAARTGERDYWRRTNKWRKLIKKSFSAVYTMKP